LKILINHNKQYFLYNEVGFIIYYLNILRILERRDNLNQEEIKKEEEIIEEVKETKEAVEEKAEEMKKEEEKIEEEVKEKFEEMEKEAEKEEEKIEEMKEGTEEAKKVEEEVKEEAVVGYKKADVFKRLVAYLIDAILVGVVASIIPFIGGLIACAYMLLRDGLDFTQNRSIGKMAFNLKPIVVENGANCDLITSAKRNWILAIGYIPSIFFKRFLTGIPFVGHISSVIYLIISFLFGIPLLIYVIIEVVLIFTDKKGLRLGDKMAGTQVIEL